MRALITGGAGFIGSHLSERLAALGYEVSIIDDLSSGKLENIEKLIKSYQIDFRRGSITDKKVADELISKCDVIFHLAAVVGLKRVTEKISEVIETNVHGSEIILKKAMKYNKKIIVVSSSEVYGKSTSIPFNEESDCTLGSVLQSRWSYAYSKSISEFYALAFWREKRLPVVIVRLFNIAGPRQSSRYGMVIPTLIRQACANQPITVYGDGNQTRCFSYVGDVVRSLIEVSRKPEAIGEIFNLGDDQEISIRDLASFIRKLTGSNSEITYVPYDRVYSVAFEDIQRRVPDISKIRKMIGYSPSVSMKELLEICIEDVTRSPTDKGLISC